MPKCYLDLVRYPSGKCVRVRADFIVMINEAKGGNCMVICADNNQIYTDKSYAELLLMHRVGMHDLEQLQKGWAGGGKVEAVNAEKPISDTDADEEIPF